MSPTSKSLPSAILAEAAAVPQVALVPADQQVELSVVQALHEGVREIELPLWVVLHVAPYGLQLIQDHPLRLVIATGHCFDPSQSFGVVDLHALVVVEQRTEHVPRALAVVDPLPVDDAAADAHEMQGPFPVPQHHLLPDSPAGVANILRLTGQAQALLAVVVHEAVRSDSSVDLLGL
eukprot:CAMPEP_0182517606 /NCGR_PEP_ID=MMETSP1321-20130603/42591_1 /TAXON_ID=91990 /ORGANISM="Bolidomonas sp., Strain RCC1657" /LENGTH=177 /DNA_ID=CAMNT_0024725365 /DNA_START=280 /DNA_END=808 /DNA_ORIENTATION=+